MKYFYYAIEREKVNSETGESYYIADVIRVAQSQNLLSVLNRFKDLISVTPAATKKAAVNMVNVWNEGFYNNGCYMFQSDARVYPAYVMKEVF